MRATTLAAVIAVVLAGCGRSGLPGEDGASGDAQVPAPPAQPAPVGLDALVGVWTFGPIVEKGFAGTPEPLASLTVRASGDFDVLFGSGCLLQFASGTVSGHALLTKTWVDEATAGSIDVSAVTVAPFGPLLLTVDVTRPDGTRLSQVWTRRK